MEQFFGRQFGLGGPTNSTVSVGIDTKLGPIEGGGEEETIEKAKTNTEIPKEPKAPEFCTLVV
jgi:hypothetical protein